MNISKISIVLSIAGIIAAIWAQSQLLEGYQSASGKTRALYGIRHFSYLGYLIFGCAGLLLSVYSMFIKEKFKMIAVTFLLAVGSILLLVLPLWRYFS